MKEILDIKRYTIIKIPIPESNNVNENLQWFGTALGLFSQRDKDKSCFRIFIELLKAAKENRFLSSDDIAKRAKLSRATVIHHLNKLMESGIISSVKNRYKLRESNLSYLIESLERDIHRSLENLKGVSKKLDLLLGLK
jgi:predicted transcriptional regulator